MGRVRCVKTTSGRTTRSPDRTAAGRPVTERTRWRAPDTVVRTDDVRHPLHRVETSRREWGDTAGDNASPFADLFPQRGRPALSPAVLALVPTLL